MSLSNSGLRGAVRQVERVLRVSAGMLVLGGALRAQVPGQELANRVWALERSGRGGAAEKLLREAAAIPDNAAGQRAYAEYLERHRAAGARAAYERLIATLERQGGQTAERTQAQHRLAVLDLLAGDKAAAARHGGVLGAPAERTSPQEYIEIPGPLTSFSRMAALSPEVALDEVLPSLGRNVVTMGYRAYSSNNALEQTEYLSLVFRYLSQARELEKLAGPDHVIRVTQCESQETGVLLRVIGYRMRGGLRL